MPVVETLIRSESDGTISFGNYKLPTKSKVQDFEPAEIYIRSRHIMRSRSLSATAPSYMNLFRARQ